MAELDQLSIQITSSSKDVEESIDSIVRGLNTLNDTLSKLDPTNITAFSRAIEKLTQVGAGTSTTNRAITNLGRQVANSFGIKTRKGVEDITEAIGELNKAQKFNDNNPGNTNLDRWFRSLDGVNEAIKANYRYKNSVDETTKSVQEYVKETNKSGRQIGMADMAKEYGEDFRAMSSVLGKAFKNTQTSTKEGVQDLEEYLREMNGVLNTSFDTEHVEIGFKQLVDTVKEAKNEVLDYKKASEQGLIDDNTVSRAVDKVSSELDRLYKEQEKYNATSGLNGLVETFEKIENMKLPDFSGVAGAISQVSKSANSIVESAPKVQEVSTATKSIEAAAQDASDGVLVLRDSLNGLGNTKKVIEGVQANLGNLETVERGFISDVQATDMGKMLPMAFDPQKYALMIPTNFDDVCRQAYEATRAVGNLKEEAEKAGSAVGNVDKNSFDGVSEGAKETTKEVQKMAQATDKLGNLVAIGHELESLSKGFGDLASKSESLLKVLTAPLKAVANEYKEKFDSMKETVTGFVDNFKAGMAKVQAFWKRTMRTFTFMIVRKVFTAIIKEINNAIQSMAKFSNAMGTQFNNSISSLVADFQYLGRSIVSVFAPLLDYIAPIIDAIVDKIATLLSYVGMLIAALTGASSFTKAKKNVTNYAASLDKASKSAKNLTMGIDELNILNENSGGGGGGAGNPLAEWEEVDIPDWIKDLSDLFKNFWDKFTAPLKEAWKRARQYVIDGAKTMVLALKRLFSDIGRDFLEMWNQEETIRMFEQLFKIIGDIFRVVRNLANAFDKAWNYNKTGLKILENIRDIMAILVDHARNISYYMIGWAKDLDFEPLLTSFERLTSSAKRLADFVGGVIEDIFVLGILKYINFLIEDAIPHLQNTIAEILDIINFTTLRKKLQPIISGVEEVAENIHTGVINAIGNLGEEIARFINSKEFYDFLESLASIMKEITAARVEKVLTGIGEGILAIAKALVKFVNSGIFQKFIKAIGEWIDKASTKQIANVLTNIAKAILVFKFAEFTTSKLSGFFRFFTMITAVNNLGKLSGDLTNLAGALGKTSEGTEVLAASGGKLAGLSSTLSTLGTALGSIGVGFLEFKGVSDSVDKLVEGTGSLGWNITELVGSVGAAAGAFTLLLGFPAGIIAAGCVGAVAAVKGIQDAIDQINFDNVTDAILTQGNTTVQQVNSWYEEATSTIRTNVDEWKNIERDLVQNRGDIDEYARSIEGLKAAFNSDVTATSGMASNLSSIYQDMGNSIKNYIDESTNSMVSNLLAQRNYFEAQGYDVDEMIANLLVGADAEKEAVDEANKAIDEASDKYSKKVDEFGRDSDEAKAAFDELKTVIGENSEVFEQFQSKIDEVDTSEAIQKITELGESLDLSNYDNWEDASADIAASIQGIKDATESGLQEVNDTYQGKINELNEFKARNPMFKEEDYQIQLDAIMSQWADDTQTLTSSAEQALNLYDTSLTNKLNEVAANAESTWESTNPFTRFFSSMGSKDEYVYSQMQNYVNEHLGDTGLTGLLNDAYAAIPNNTRTTATSAMTDLVNDSAQAYQQALDGDGKFLTDIATGTYQGVLDSIPDLVEYDPSNKAFIDRQLNAAKLAAEGAHYDEISGVLVDKTGQALINSSSDLEAYNRTLAGQGVNAMSDEFKTQLSEQAEVFEAVKAFGKDIPKGVVEGIDEEVDTGSVLDSVEDIFKPIPGYIHDLPFFPFGSPNLKMKEYGADTVLGYNEGIEENAEKTDIVIDTWFKSINDSVKSKVSDLFKGVDASGSLKTIFASLTTEIAVELNALGTSLAGSLLPTFMQTYITPFFSEEEWHPLFDGLINGVFTSQWSDFSAWFDESMSSWWKSSVLPWFLKSFWDNEIFSPVKTNIVNHWSDFLTWWDTMLSAWWNNHVKPWPESWITLIDSTGGNTKVIVQNVFSYVEECIRSYMEKSKQDVIDACNDILEAFDEVTKAMKNGFGDFKGTLEFKFGQFAVGGFPEQGSLFLANEAGAELVGTVGGRTAVASNQEITGIADAVYATGNQESELLGQLITLGRAMLDKDPIVIDDKDIAKMANSGRSKLGMSIIS